MSAASSVRVGLLRVNLFNHDNMIRARITDGTIMQAMDDEIEGMLTTFQYATSADPNMRAVFLEFPIVQNFVISWANDKDDPSFLQDWQATLGRGGTRRQREARRQGPAVADTAMPDAASPPHPQRPTEVDRRTRSNQPLAMGMKKQTGPPQPRRRSHVDEQPVDRPSRQTTPPDGPLRGAHPMTRLTRPFDMAPIRGQPNAQTNIGTSFTAPSNATQTEDRRGNPARIRFVDPVEADEMSTGSEEDRMPDRTGRSKDKGKAKAKAKELPSDIEMGAPTDADVAVRQRSTQRRKPEAATGVHNPPCDMCRERQLTCYKEVGGGSCFPCKTRKSKCSHAGTKGIKGGRYSVRKPLARASEAEGGRKRMRRTTKSTAVLDETDEEPVVREVDPLLQLTAALKKLEEHKRPRRATTRTKAQSRQMQRADEDAEESATEDVARPAIQGAEPSVTDAQDPVDKRIVMYLEAFEANMMLQLNVHARRLDDEERRMQLLEDMVHRIDDRLGAILDRAGTRMTALEVDPASRLERLERMVDHMVVRDVVTRWNYTGVVADGRSGG
ncbi:hypothetical protein F5887DRAFT_1002674 [Amanita rubescens]|nr:hypothetical protein F5887DRAFT_1002674 [Amanita rubescens]